MAVFQRTFAFVCMLHCVMGMRPVAVQDVDATAARLRGCDEDKLPTKEANTYCAAFSKDPEACRANGCRSLDLLTHLGSLVCKAACQTSSTPVSAAAMHFSNLTESAVPQAVKDAVKAARELVQAGATAAANKAQAAQDADTAAKAALATSKKKEEEAAAKLREAAELEAKARATKDSMESAIAEAKAANKDLNAQAAAYEAALVAKDAKKTEMMKKLKAKQEQEAEWTAEDSGFKDEMDKINKELPALEEQLAALTQLVANKKARRVELSKKRVANKQTRQTVGKTITQDYMAALAAYKADKKKVEDIAAAEAQAQAASQQAAGSEKAAIRDYWQKVADFRLATDQRTTAESDAEEAQNEYLAAQLALTEKSLQMTEAARDRDQYEALRIKIEGVYEYAKIFYNKLGEVKQPAGNPMMAVMNLVKDPAMKPCLSSYNVIVTAANDIGQTDQTQIIAKLKTGLIQIDQDRYQHFAQWCGKEDFKYWIWGANELEQVELAI